MSYKKRRSHTDTVNTVNTTVITTTAAHYVNFMRLSVFQCVKVKDGSVSLTVNLTEHIRAAVRALMMKSRCYQPAVCHQMLL